MKKRGPAPRHEEQGMSMRRCCFLIATSFLLIGILAPAALAGNKTRRVSVDTEGGDPVGFNGDPSVSADGRFVAFSSYADDLVAGDRNRLTDVFVRDVRTRTTVRASADIGGGDPSGHSYDPSISADGRFVAFSSDAPDLVAGDENGYRDVFVRDLVTETTVRASLDARGGDPNEGSYTPSITPDGRYVAFSSWAFDLVVGDGNRFFDVFVRDLVAGKTVRASVDIGGGDPDDGSYDPSISADSRYVAFSSDAPDLVAGDENGYRDVFVRDLVTGTTARASVDTVGEDPDAGSNYPSISADGRYVAFDSWASDLVAGDTNALSDVFVRDLVAGASIRVSVDTGGGNPNNSSKTSSITADGRYVAFGSHASDLIVGDGNEWSDVFVRDLVAGATVRASVDIEGGDPNGPSYELSISSNARYVAFSSFASDLVDDDGNRRADVFMTRDPALAGVSG